MHGLDILENLISNLGPLWDVIEYGAYLCGIVLMVSGFTKIAAQKGQRSGAFVTIIVASLLLSLPFVLDSLSLTFFGNTSLHSLSYTRKGSGPEQVYIHAAIFIIQLTGFWSICKALWLCHAAQRAGDPNTPWRAIVHGIAGICCVNIVRLMQVLGGTFGGDVQSTISKLLTSSPP